MNVIIFFTAVWTFSCFMWHTDAFTEFKKEKDIDPKKIAYVSKFLPNPIIPLVVLVLAILASQF